MEATDQVKLNLTAVESNITQPFASRLYEKMLIPPLLVGTIYLSVCAVVYQCKPTRQTMKWTNRLCTVSSILLVVTVVSVMPEVYPATVVPIVCDLQFPLTISTYSLNRSFFSLLLWLRQKRFYGNIAFLFKGYKMRIINFFQYVVLALNVGSLAPTVLLISHRLTPTERGCEITGEEPIGFVQVGLVLFMSSQLMLLVLTMVPFAFIMQQSAATKSALMRIFLVTCACVITDVVILAAISSIQTRLQDFSSRSFIVVVHCYNLLFNNASTMLTFTDFRERFLLPVKSRVAPEQTPSPENGDK